MEALSSDLSRLDFNPGCLFESKVRSRLRSSVTSPFPDDGTNFWLVASFSRSKFRLNPEFVAHLLQSVIGGTAKHFAVVELDHWVFKFSVKSRQVGLMIYGLKSFASPDFKILFNLWNPRGLQCAIEAVTADHSPDQKSLLQKR